jgi:hypothetical protein
VESLLVAPGNQRLVLIQAETAISGLERHGIPYIERGDEFVLVLRACDGNEREPGLAGIRLLIADRLVRHQTSAISRPNLRSMHQPSSRTTPLQGRRGSRPR